MQIEELRTLTYQFRKGAETALRKKLFSSQPFNDFPNACCGDAVWLIAQYLMDHYSDNTAEYRYVYGSYFYDDFANRFGHAWLEVRWPNLRKKVIVDITSDQRQFQNANIFPPCALVPYYVGKKNAFFALFEEYPSQCGILYGLKTLTGDEYKRMYGLYDTILGCVDG